MADNCTKRVRKLYDWEIEEFSAVFGDSLDYQRVRIHECTSWPDWIDRLGRFLKRMPAPGLHDHNAVTLGNHCFFPVDMPEELLPVEHQMSFKHEWLVHEVTHAWQFQRSGWIYLFKALISQFRDKEKAYDFEGESGLLKSREKGKLFKEFNPEQQGNITQSFYWRYRRKKPTQAWDPFIEEIKRKFF